MGSWASHTHPDYEDGLLSKGDGPRRTRKGERTLHVCVRIW